MAATNQLRLAIVVAFQATLVFLFIPPGRCLWAVPISALQAEENSWLLQFGKRKMCGKGMQYMQLAPLAPEIRFAFLAAVSGQKVQAPREVLTERGVREWGR
jgi:hypothetical protein